MEGNLKYWDALKQKPSEALREIKGGRLAGKTDINPQWRYKAMTEQFGVCGVGWKYTVEKLWLEPAGDQICAFAEVGLAIKVDGEWSAPIPGVGGSMILEQETKGLHVSDECYKMAITDALSVAMKMIGVAADVYAGLFDGSKYSEEKKASQKQETQPPDKRSHWCNIHNTKFFKAAKMHSYGHPIDNTSEWCYEAKQEPGATEEKAPPLKNRGELFTRAAQFGLSPRDVLSAVKVSNPEITKEEEIADFDGAWVATAIKFAPTIKATQEAK